MAHNPTLHCDIAASTIRTMNHESAAFFENILVTLNGTSTGIDLLGTSCRSRAQRTNQYTVSCFHQEDMIRQPILSKIYYDKVIIIKSSALYF